MQQIKKITFQKGRALICAPITGKTLADIEAQCGMVLEEKPDIIEFRADFLNEPTSQNICEALERINALLPEFPMIFTLRRPEEGGFCELSDEQRHKILLDVLDMNIIDVLDVELFSPRNIVESILSKCKQKNIYSILSNHDFKKTPLTHEILDILSAMQSTGCDIAKIAYAPKTIEDVLAVLQAKKMFCQTHPDMLVIAISMGEIGLVSRAAAGLFGSCVTYAKLGDGSAPGQITIKNLNEFNELLNLKQ